MTSQLHKTVQGLTDAVIKTPTGKLLVLPTAAGGVFNPGVKTEEIMSMSGLGEMVVVDTYTSERKPEVKLEWKQSNVLLLAMSLGLEFQSQNNVASKVIGNGFLVKQNNYAASTTGFEGFGMTADQTDSVAYYLAENDLPVVLTRQPYATFDPTIALSFAQGANGAHKWSNDLLNKYVAYEFPQELASALVLTDNKFDNFSISMMAIMNDRSLFHWEFPSVSVKLDDSDVSLNEAKSDITFRVQDDGSECLSYRVTYKGKAQSRTCTHAAA